MEEITVALQGWPSVIRQEDLTTTGIVLTPGQLQNRESRGYSSLRAPRTEVGLRIQSRIDLKDGGGRCPGSFLSIREHELTVGCHAEAIGITYTSRQDFDLVGLAQSQDALVARCSVETTLRIGIESNDEIMPAGRCGHGVVHAFIEIGLTIAVEVMQTGDLIAPEDVQFVVDDLNAQCLM